jgi:hypothetical protein
MQANMPKIATRIVVRVGVPKVGSPGGAGQRAADEVAVADAGDSGTTVAVGAEEVLDAGALQPKTERIDARQIDLKLCVLIERLTPRLKHAEAMIPD